MNPFLEDEEVEGVNPFLEDEEKVQTSPEKEKTPSFLEKVITGHPMVKAAHATKVLGGDLLEAIKNGLLTTVAGAPGVSNQVINEPGRFGKNLGGGFLGLSEKLLNIPHNLPEFMTHLGLAPEGTKGASKYIPKFELQEDVANFYGKPKSETDKLVRGIIENADILAPTGRAVTKGIGRATGMASNTKRLEQKLLEKGAEEEAAKAYETEAQYAAKEEAGFKTPEALANAKKNASTKLERLKNLEQNPEVPPEEIAEAENAYNQANAEFQKSKAAAKGKFGVNTQYSIQDRLGTAKEHLTNLQKELEEHPPTTEDEMLAHQQEVERATAEYNEAKNAAEQSHEVGTSNPNSIIRKMNEIDSDLLKTNQELEELNKVKEPDIKASQEIVDNATKTHKEAVKVDKDIDKDVGEHLKVGDEHDVDVAKRTKESLIANTKDIGKSLNGFKQGLADQNIVIDNTPKIKELTEGINDLVKEGKLNSKEIKEMGKELADMPKREIIPAQDFISMYQTLGTYIREAYEKAYKPGRTEEESALWKGRAEEAKVKLDEMEKHIKENIGEENFDAFQKARGRWRKEQVPLYGEPLYWQLMNKREALSSDMMAQLRGAIPGSGLEIIRNTIMNNPESVKNVIGQKFETKSGREKVYKPNKQMQQWIDRLPELKTKINQKAEAQSSVSKAEQNVKDAEVKHKEIESQYAAAEEAKAKIEKREAEKAEKEKRKNLLAKFKEEVEKKKAKKEESEKLAKEKAEQTKAQKEIKEKISSFEKEIPEMEKYLDVITDTELKKINAETKLGNIRKKSHHYEKMKQRLEDNKSHLEEIIKNADKHIPKLKEARKNREASEAARKEAEAALNNAEKIRSKAWKKLIVVGSALASYSGAKSAYNVGKELLK